MHILDYSSDSPAENLALEEVLLDEVEQGRRSDTLRFWESPRPFVVLGTAQKLAQEVHEEHCQADGVPIMRRCSAGGCVLQGPGSLNFSLFLRYDTVPEVASLHASYAYIGGLLCGALATLGITATRQGVSDIAIDGRKVSGNAQRRRRHAMLHHGTLLYRADMAAMARYLREPVDRPEYRADRDHEAFLTTLPADSGALRDALCNNMPDPGIVDVCRPEELAAARVMATEKYTSRGWIYRR